MTLPTPYYRDDDNDIVLYRGDALELLPLFEPGSVDAVVTDPPYAEIDRDYGRMTEKEWHAAMNAVVGECRLLLSGTGSAVFVLQPNSERVGRMRPWVWEFMARWAREWNMPQDAYWWNHCTPPTVHCNRVNGLMRPSLKVLVWLGGSDCYRDQEEVLWTESMHNAACRNGDRALKMKPSGLSMRSDRCASAAIERGGVTPFNVFPIQGANTEKGEHGAATPIELADILVRYLCPEDGIVCDPFCGSGTTLVACLRTGRRGIGIEISPEYCEIAAERLRREKERTILFDQKPKHHQRELAMA